VEKAGYVESQALRLRNEIAVQLKESRGLMEARDLEISELKNALPQIAAAVRRLEKEYRDSGESWSSEVETAVEQAARRLGALDEEIKQAYQRRQLASIVAELQEKRDKLRNEEAKLTDRVTALVAKQSQRREEVAVAVAKNAMRLLREDLPRQKEFIDPRSFVFDFVENSVYVNGAKHFSESSTVLLRHVFHCLLRALSLSSCASPGF
jgi:predicted  nucleic acid-binding Zn-ribbon protein